MSLREELFDIEKEDYAAGLLGVNLVHNSEIVFWNTRVCIHKNSYWRVPKTFVTTYY